MLPRKGMKGSVLTQSNKENFEEGLTNLAGERRHSLAVSEKYQFVESYVPEGNEFHPLPITLGVEFAEVCSGPPWTVGDATESLRRKELERSATQEPESQPPFSLSSPRPLPSKAYVPPPIRSQFVPSRTNNPFFGKTILSIIEPKFEVQEKARNFIHLKIASEFVPLVYMRAKIPELYPNYFLDQRTASHYLQLISSNHETGTIPIHDLVLIAQCFELQNVTKLQTTVENSTILVVENVPDIHSFGILLWWLYSNNEDELYESLREADENMLMGFALNCKFWGVVDFRVRGVIRTVLEELEYELA